MGKKSNLYKQVIFVTPTCIPIYDYMYTYGDSSGKKRNNRIRFKPKLLKLLTHLVKPSV